MVYRKPSTLWGCIVIGGVTVVVMVHSHGKKQRSTPKKQSCSYDHRYNDLS